MKNPTQSGFSQIILFLILGAGLILFAFSSYIPYLKNFDKKNSSSPPPTRVEIPQDSSPSLTENQQMLLRNKESIMLDLNIDEAEFNNLLRYASDPEFDY